MLLEVKDTSPTVTYKFSAGAYVMLVVTYVGGGSLTVTLIQLIPSSDVTAISAPFESATNLVEPQVMQLKGLTEVGRVGNDQLIPSVDVKITPNPVPALDPHAANIFKTGDQAIPFNDVGVDGEADGSA